MKFLAFLYSVASVAATIDWNTVVPTQEVDHQITFLPNVLESRIINGQVARPKQFPYQAGLQIKRKEGVFWCGGTLISNKWVLTAAHCTETMLRINVVLGALDLSDRNEQRRLIITVYEKNVIVHEYWDSHTKQNDISLIQLPYPVQFNDYIQPAKLPTNRFSTYSGDYAIASGWGRISDSASAPTNKLRWVKVPILDNSVCNEFYSFATRIIIQTSQICISTERLKAVCMGDSGGPLVLAYGSNTVIGIASFGLASGCENGFPQVFTRITSHLDWIAEHTGIAVAGTTTFSPVTVTGVASSTLHHTGIATVAGTGTTTYSPITSVASCTNLRYVSKITKTLIVYSFFSIKI